MAGSSLSFGNSQFRTSGGIRYKVYQGSPTLKINDEGANASETYLMAVDDVLPFLTEAMPPPFVLGQRVIIPPRRTMPGSPALVTKSIECSGNNDRLPWDPFGRFSSSVEAADLARVKIEYETSPYSTDDGSEPDPEDPITFLEHSFDFGGEFLVVPPTNMKAVDGTTPGDDDDYPYDDNDITQGDDTEEPGDAIQVDPEVRDPMIKAIKVLPTINHSFRWPLALNPNFANILNALGKTNDRASAIMFGAERHTILFMGVSGKRKFLWQNGRTSITPYDLTFKFACKRGTQKINGVDFLIGWNHVYRPELGRFQIVLVGSGANQRALYEETNLDNIFKARTQPIV